MGTINSSDVIFATVMQQGQTIMSMQMSGMSSFSDVMKKIRNTLAKPIGLVTLILRNSSQGWARQSALMLNTRKCAAAPTVQLTLF